MRTFLNVLICFTLFLFLSCAGPSSEYAVRVRMVSSTFNNPTVIVNLEGYDGDAVESALVTVKDPGNRVYILDFMDEYGAYRKVLESRLSGSYTINVDSVLDTLPVSVVFEHKILASAPVISSIIDASGNNTVNGDSIDVSRDISISWTDLGDDVSYMIKINSGTTVEYQTTSAAASCVIPAGSVSESASLSVSISAICQYGDPELIIENYCSVNSIDGSPYVFTTN